MSAWFESIKNGIEIYLKLAPLAMLIMLFFTSLNRKRFNPVRFIAVQGLILYMICLVEVVLFPLPDAVSAAGLSGYHGQYLPFKFVSDIFNDRTVESVLQVILNIALTVPFGLFFKFFTNIKRRNVVLLTFLLSLTVEIAQLTGLFFIYPGSYRLFDVDDLMLNTLGGYAGCLLSDVLRDIVPDLKRFDTVYLNTIIE